MATYVEASKEDFKIIKMSIPPNLLYLFLALPIPIPVKQFRQWNKQLSRFIWLNEKPRMKFSTLQSLREKGGLALPSLRDFYLSAQLRSLVCWCNPSYCARWMAIEMSLSETPIQSRLGHTASELGNQPMGQFDIKNMEGSGQAGTTSRGDKTSEVASIQP